MKNGTASAENQGETFLPMESLERSRDLGESGIHIDAADQATPNETSSLVTSGKSLRLPEPQLTRMTISMAPLQP